MSFKNGVLEGSGFDFGSPRARFWRVRGPFFRDLGPLGEKNAGTDFELEAKAAQFQLGARVARSSYFYVEVRPRSSTSKSGRDLLKRVGLVIPPRGGFQSAAHRRCVQRARSPLSFSEGQSRRPSLSYAIRNTLAPPLYNLSPVRRCAV